MRHPPIALTRWSLRALMAAVLLPGSTGAQESPPFQLQNSYDVIIRNGKVLDGMGNPWFYADVALNGDRIAAVGDLSDARGTEEIDATGLFVAPGFIDTHTHIASFRLNFH